jgi:hypothetical protein
MSASPTPVPFAKTPFEEGYAALSPDGRNIAYVSTESGTEEVYVQSFPSGGHKRRVSTSGGREPRWRSDGKELFFLRGVLSHMQIMAVSINGNGELGAPASLGSFNSSSGALPVNRFLYAPLRDGSRFVVTRHSTDDQPTVNVLLNWRMPEPEAAR